MAGSPNVTLLKPASSSQPPFTSETSSSQSIAIEARMLQSYEIAIPLTLVAEFLRVTPSTLETTLPYKTKLLKESLSTLMVPPTTETI